MPSPMTAPALKEPPKISIRRIRRSQLPADTIQLSRFLIGKVVVHELPAGRVSGSIVETEAYPPGDPAGHHFRGPTPRIRSMYLAPGHVYVFFNYGAHFMLNVVSERPETAAAILIRALEALEGIEIMQRHRKTTELLDLTRGPGVSQKPCRSIAATTESISARRKNSGLARSTTPWAASARACASASRARPT